MGSGERSGLEDHARVLWDPWTLLVLAAIDLAAVADLEPPVDRLMPADGALARALWWALMIAAALGLGAALERLLGWPGPASWSTTLQGVEVTFLAPRAFWALTVLPLIPALSSLTLTGFSWTQRTLNVALRCAMIAALIVAAARPSTTRHEHAICTVYLVDVSASVPDAMLAEVPDAIAPSYPPAGQTCAPGDLRRAAALVAAAERRGTSPDHAA